MLGRIGAWLDDYGPDLVNAVALLIMAYVGVHLSALTLPGGFKQFATSWLGVVFWAAVLLTLVGVCISVMRTKRLTPLQQKANELEAIAERAASGYYLLCSMQLADILRDELGYGDTERISVYRHRGKGAFQILGRYSDNPNYREVTRHVYPDNEGVIGAAWAHGTKSVDNLPDPQTERERYYEVLERDWSISRKTAEDFAMESRSLVGRALYEPQKRFRVAIIVVESTKVGILNKRRVVEALDGTSGVRVYNFLEQMRSVEPDFYKTSTAGF